MCEPVANGRQFRFGSIPANEGVAYGVLAHAEAGFGGERLQPRPRPQIIVGEDDARYGCAARHRLCVSEPGQGVEFAAQPCFVDGNLHL